jgi:hypothetical protein
LGFIYRYVKEADIKTPPSFGALTLSSINNRSRVYRFLFFAYFFRNRAQLAHQAKWVDVLLPKCSTWQNLILHLLLPRANQTVLEEVGLQSS